MGYNRRMLDIWTTDNISSVGHLHSISEFGRKLSSRKLEISRLFMRFPVPSHDLPVGPEHRSAALRNYNWSIMIVM